jgi:toxin ParE1/3/4
MRVRFTSRAFADLGSIHSYLVERNPKAAGELISFIEALMRGLGDFPEIGQRSDELNVRVILAGRYPYRIYYQAEDDEIVVLHIRHTARKAPEADDL